MTNSQNAIISKCLGAVIISNAGHNKSVKKLHKAFICT